MADIFISYSSKDHRQTEQLVELLSSSGLSVWIDKHGIQAASSWSEEIVDAIDNCHTFIVMLSRHSIVSQNVVKEVSLASEKGKKILPLDLEAVEIPKSMQYALAGLQRAPMTNIDAVIRAIGRLGLEATSAPVLKLIKETGSRKSLMILPFEDFSPTGDNAWFADGIVAELIGALTHVTALRVTDVQTTKAFKHYQGTLPNYAREMSTRYFVEGSVRKFGDQIKISVMLLDIETGDYLWQDSLRGTMDDVFAIQESVTEKVVTALKIYLGNDEQQKLSVRRTENPEAYELYLRAMSYTDRHTREGFELGISLLREAIQIDPNFAMAYRSCAHALLSLHRIYDHAPSLVDEAERFNDRALELDPTLYRAYDTRSIIYMRRGMHKKAEEAARKYIELAPNDYSSHFALAFFYMEIGYHEKAIAPFEAAATLKPDHLSSLFNVCNECHKAHQFERSIKWCKVAVPVYERHLRLQPDADQERIFLGAMLLWLDKRDDAIKAVEPVMRKQHLDPFTRYGLACMYADLCDYPKALTVLRRSIEEGFLHHPLIEGWLNDRWVKDDPEASTEIESIIALAKERALG